MSHNTKWSPLDQSEYEIKGIPEDIILNKDYVKFIGSLACRITMRVYQNDCQVCANWSLDFFHQMINKYIDSTYTQEQTFDTVLQMLKDGGMYLFFCPDIEQFVFGGGRRDAHFTDPETNIRIWDYDSWFSKKESPIDKTGLKYPFE